MIDFALLIRFLAKSGSQIPVALGSAVDDVEHASRNVDAIMLTAPRAFQGEHTTRIIAAYPVCERFFCHVAEISPHTKLLKSVPTGYSIGRDLTVSH